MGIILYNRIDASSENWKYFSCKLTGKEQTMINCSDKNKDFIISGDQVSFAGRGSWNSVYIPFSSDRITLRIDPETRAGYDFWVLYDTFGWKELQKVDNELIADTTAEESEKVARWKRNDNFFFEKDALGYGIIIQLIRENLFGYRCRALERLILINGTNSFLNQSILKE